MPPAALKGAAAVTTRSRQIAMAQALRPSARIHQQAALAVSSMDEPVLAAQGAVAEIVVGHQ